MTRPLILGLTGAIGMGKSTTAALFAAEGAAVWDADAAVHRLYAPGGAAVPAVASLCPEAVRHGAVDRTVLRKWLAAAPDRLAKLEPAVHPLVAADRARFVARAAAEGRALVVLDVPLLFEAGGDADCDVTVVVSAPEEVQRARVLARPSMTEDTFDRLRARQLSDAEKRARADHVIETTSLDAARAQVRALLAQLRSRQDA